MWLPVTLSRICLYNLMQATYYICASVSSPSELCIVGRDFSVRWKDQLDLALRRSGLNFQSLRVFHNLRQVTRQVEPWFPSL